MRTWFENEAILQQVRDVLARTEEEMRQVTERSPQLDGSDTDELPTVGLLQLMEAFTALRQELKLQTKSSRGLDESVRNALAGLDRAVAHMQSVESREESAVATAVHPLVMSLIELDEALERGEQAFLLIEQQVMQQGMYDLDESLEQQFARLSRWQRWRARWWHQTVREVCQGHLADLSERLLSPLREGYELIRARLQRLLAAQQIRRISCIGLPVDPSRMNVIELVDLQHGPPGTVVEELRPGYTWRNRVMRCAEVRAVCQRPRAEQAWDAVDADTWDERPEHQAPNTNLDV